jgi:hypothetical protein
MSNKNQSLTTRKARFAQLLSIRGCLFSWGLLLVLPCHLCAIDLMFKAVISKAIFEEIALPTIVYSWWLELSGPGIIPFLMIIGGLLFLLVVSFQLYLSLLEAFTFTNFPPEIVFLRNYSATRCRDLYPKKAKIPICSSSRYR